LISLEGSLDFANISKNDFSLAEINDLSSYNPIWKLFTHSLV
jgi:hypothetical protein